MPKSQSASWRTNSPEETQKVASDFARELLARKPVDQAVVLALSGDLGAGKTTFLQGLAQGLGIAEVVNSPTFIIMKKFKIQNSKCKNFYHFDCYRLDAPEDVAQLGFNDIIANPENIVAIEWPEKISALLPKNLVAISFSHLQNNTREITIG